MNLVLKIVLILLLAGCPAPAKAPKAALARLVSRIGPVFWSAARKRLLRATFYRKGYGKSDELIGLRYASKHTAGTLAVPDWLPRGSLVRIHTTHGVLSFIAADEGSAVAGKPRKPREKQGGREPHPFLISALPASMARLHHCRHLLLQGRGPLRKTIVR